VGAGKACPHPYILYESVIPNEVRNLLLVRTISLTKEQIKLKQLFRINKVPA